MLMTECIGGECGSCFGVSYMVSLDCILDDVVYYDRACDGSELYTFVNGDVALLGDMITNHRFWQSGEVYGSEFCDFCGEHVARHGVF